MVLKQCVICGEAFDAQGKDITCSPHCSKVNSDLYNKAYYNKNWLKWRWYKRQKKTKEIGTTDLVSSMRRDSLGDADFVAEQGLLQHELHRLGLR